MVAMPRSQLFSLINITVCAQQSKWGGEEACNSDTNNKKRSLTGTTIKSKMEIIKHDESSIMNKNESKEYVQNAGTISSKVESKRQGVTIDLIIFLAF